MNKDKNPDLYHPSGADRFLTFGPSVQTIASINVPLPILDYWPWWIFTILLLLVSVSSQANIIRGYNPFGLYPVMILAWDDTLTNK